MDETGIRFAPEMVGLFSLCESQHNAEPVKSPLYSPEYVLHTVKRECGFNFTLRNILER